MQTKLERYLAEADAAAQAASKYEASGLADVAQEYRKIERAWRALAESISRRERTRTMGDA